MNTAAMPQTYSANRPEAPLMLPLGSRQNASSLALKSERSASPVFARTQLWQCGTGEALVIFSPDEKRCSVFLHKAPKGVSLECLFDELELAYRPGFSLDPSIDCYAISCSSDDVDPLLDSLTSCLG